MYAQKCWSHKYKIEIQILLNKAHNCLLFIWFVFYWFIVFNSFVFPSSFILVQQVFNFSNNDIKTRTQNSVQFFNLHMENWMILQILKLIEWNIDKMVKARLCGNCNWNYCIFQFVILYSYILSIIYWFFCLN